jgi:hypothetical protein
MATIIFRPAKAGDSTGIPTQYPASGQHWDKVDEVVLDETDYLQSTQSGACLDLFGFDPTVQGGRINYVRVYFYVWSDFVTFKYRAAIKLSEIYYGTDTHNLNENVNEFFFMEWPLNPATSSLWTWSDIYSSQFGIELTGTYTESNRGRVTQCYMEIDYTVENVKPGLFDMGMM